MARIRTIKPEFWTDEDLSEVSAEAALLAIGLLNHADDEGYFSANPGLVKAAVFPIRETYRSTTVLIRELYAIGYLKLYLSTDGRRFGKITNFENHQVINKKKPSKIKALQVRDEYGIDTVPLPEDYWGERKGKERKGNTHTNAGAGAHAKGDSDQDSGANGADQTPQEPTPPTADLTTLSTRISDNWEPDKTTQDRIAINGLRTYATADERLKFIAHQQAAGRIAADWGALWIKWLVTARAMNNGRRNETTERHSAGAGASAADRNAASFADYQRRATAVDPESGD